MSENNNLPLLDVLYEDNHLLAVNKPAGMLVQGDKSGDESLLERTREWIRVKYNKPGNVYCGLVHRLDRPASGVVMFAKTSKAASRLSDQFRRHVPEKTYRVAVLAPPPQDEGRLHNWLVPGSENRITRIGRKSDPKAKESTLTYYVLQRQDGMADLQVMLESGRKHQIRCQLAHIGCVVVGDVKYGAPCGLYEGRAIALHAEKLVVKHPARDEMIAVTSPLPPYWPI